MAANGVNGQYWTHTESAFDGWGGLGDATVLARYTQSTWLATSGAWIHDDNVWYDYTDGAGHGILYGNQFIYWTLTSASTSTTNRISVKIMYRIKRVRQSELLGLVLQSNQN